MEKTPQSNRDSIMSNLELPKGSKKWSLEAESDEEEDANGKAEKVAEEVEEEKEKEKEKVESDDEDPLDKYMSEINTEVR
jgi:uncharacterized protein YjbJ (UPF0337 family)